MDFKNQGRPLADEGMDNVCSTLGVLESEIWALITVETRGFGFWQDRRPQIVLERHIFHHRTDGRYDNTISDISNSKPGGYNGGADEYTRFEGAMNLDTTAALQSASWDIGQVIGCDYKVAGYPTVFDR